MSSQFDQDDEDTFHKRIDGTQELTMIFLHRLHPRVQPTIFCQERVQMRLDQSWSRYDEQQVKVPVPASTLTGYEALFVIVNSVSSRRDARTLNFRESFATRHASRHRLRWQSSKIFVQEGKNDSKNNLRKRWKVLSHVSCTTIGLQMTITKNIAHRILDLS